IWKATTDGAEITRVTNATGTAPFWAPDGKTIYFVSVQGTGQAYTLERPGLNIWRVQPDGSGERPVTDLRGKRGFLGPNIATDGKWLYFTWREDVSDIWMMDVSR